MVNDHDDHKSPKNRVAGTPLLKCRTLWLISMGDPNGPYVSAGGMILKEADLLFKKTYYC